MPVCEVCGLPLVWSVARDVNWCAVYGTHPPVPPAPIWRELKSRSGDRHGGNTCRQNIAAPNARLIALVMAVDEEEREDRRRFTKERH